MNAKIIGMLGLLSMGVAYAKAEDKKPAPAAAKEEKKAEPVKVEEKKADAPAADTADAGTKVAPVKKGAKTK